ncbi:Apple domain-containing protein [Caenorhabditis elegans]|uniref:Apple domain-containing protein n=1 Tax=Caenorhabditis elegans TaxID=6239 RepID=Q21782_CAEEL|nr:Apple domain-containing protein [Caenorhabditis elegans]CAA91764.4 Apple domain-containing protein [Caenorhabditis elegans]|eukprot:NP_509797.4 Uncharacterized protein CELE_R07A4.4 [Caenorhabditis elegans]
MRLLPIFLLFVLVQAQKNKCFVSHKNIRISCGKSIDTRTSITLEECESACVRYNTQCQTIQYDYYRNICEIFNVPSPLQMNKTTSEEMQKREIALGNTECAIASLLPTIDTTHLIPNWDCLSELSHSVLNSSQLTQSSQQLDLKPVKSPTFTGELATPQRPKPDIKIKKIANEQFEIVSNTIGGAEESRKEQKVALMAEPIDNINQQQQFDNTLRNFAVEVLPIVPDCPLGEHSRVQIIEGVEVSREATITFQVAILEQCVQACRVSTYADGSRLPLLCRSAHFNRATRQCSVYSDAINPNGYLEYKPNQNVIYIEKICIPDTVLPMSCDDVFRRIPQHILLGHASEVISVASENECVLECIKAKTLRSVACHSILHYPDFSSLNCILNVHTRHTKNQYFTPELAYKVDYVELGSCVTSAASGQLASRAMIPPNPFNKPAVAADNQVGVGSVTSEWTEWTHCDEKTSTRSRQRVCNGCNEIIQFMPCFSSNNFDVALQKFIKEQQQKEAIVDQAAQAKEIDAEKKLLQQLDANPTVIEFPQKIDIVKQAPKNSVEFFGPPQVPQQQSQALNTF